MDTSASRRRSSSGRRTSAILLRVAAAVALLAAAVLIAVPVGVVSDSQCGSVPEATFSRFKVCSDAGRPRFLVSIALTCVAIVVLAVSWKASRRKHDVA